MNAPLQGILRKEIDVQELININHRLLLLLGFTTSLVASYKLLEVYHDDKEKCDWFFNAVQAVVYENKPLPPLP